MWIQYHANKKNVDSGFLLLLNVFIVKSKGKERRDEEKLERRKREFRRRQHW